MECKKDVECFPLGSIEKLSHSTKETKFEVEIVKNGMASKRFIDMTVDSDSLSQQTIIWNGSSSITNRTETEYQPSAGISKRVTVTKADGTKSISEYENGLLIRMIEKDSNGGIVTQTSYDYDSYGRQNTITDLRNGTTTVTYDAADRVVTMTDPLSQSTTNHYDILGRIWKVDYPDGGSLTNVYDAKGNLALSYGSRQFPVGYGYDRLDRVTSMTNWTEYPGSGARVTQWQFSNRGFLTNKVYADQSRMAYTYTAGGKLASKIGRQITSSYGDWVEVLYSYNTAGDLKSVRNSLWLTPGITNTYNRLGLLENIVQGTNTTTRSYDHAGQLLCETYTGGTLSGFSVNYSYDSLMRLSQLRVPGVLTNTYSYDTAGRVTSLSNGNYSAHYSYMTNSPLISSVTHKQGSTARLTTAMGYDQLNRMTNIVSTPSGAGQTTWSYTAAYNQVNQRTRTTLADDSYWDYTYDDLGQLDSGGKHTSAGTQISGRQFTYDQDEIGNRISVNSSTSYTANNVNQYIAINSQNLTYDGDGNLLTDGVWTYTWDGENRLTRMVSTNLTKTLAFTYDYQGRRIEKKVWNNTTGSGTPATYLKYIYDGWNLIAELNGNSSDAVVRTYSWGPEAQGVPGTLRMISDNNGVYFPAYDPNGNVMGLVKATDGTVCAQYEYLPYGEQVTATGTMAASNPIRFSTKYRDNENGLYYYGYRYYSPDMGRWLSRDPIEERGGLNLYAFVNNDPVNHYDKLGNKCCVFTYPFIPLYSWGHEVLKCDNGVYISKYPSTWPISSPIWEREENDSFFTSPQKICSDCLDEEKIKTWFESIKSSSQYYTFYCQNCVNAVLDAIAAGLDDSKQIKPNLCDCPKTSCLTYIFGGRPYIEDVLHPFDGPHEYMTYIPLPGASADSIDRLNKNKFLYLYHREHYLHKAFSHLFQNNLT